MELDFENVVKCKFTLSANEIRQFSECPRKRYYASRDCLAIRETKKASSLQLGTAFHAALAFYYLEMQKWLDNAGIIVPTEKDVIDAYANIGSWEPEEDMQLNTDEEKTLWLMIDNYMETLKRDLTKYRFISAEQNFQLQNWPIEDVLYHGSIDLVVQSYEDNKYYFFENKTCKAFRPYIYSRFDIQLHIYDAYGAKQFGKDWGGMILNQVKKAKTKVGYGEARDLYQYDQDERDDFFTWLKAKTEALASENNIHAPCNNYMTCKMCQYASICMKYGYKVPRTYEEIVKDPFFTTQDENAESKPMYVHDPRDAEEEEG